jgi:hypothetical protein
VSATRPTTHVAALGLSAIAELHCVWATGSPWPLSTREALSDQVAGTTSRKPPSTSACLAVAATLAAAAALVEGHPRSRPALARLGSGAVVAVLTLRGGLGMAGRTDLISPGSTSVAFRSRDRRIYSPLCLTLAALSLPATVSRRP